MLKSSVLLWISVLAISLIACDDHRIYDEYQTVSGAWSMDDIKSFSLQAPDTTNTYNLFVNLRNTDDYKYSNLFLIVELSYPNGKTIIDTLTYKMARPDGTFLGTGFTDVKENKLWYKGYNSPFVFEESGDYTINIQQAMRENGAVNGIEQLAGITEVGFRVENSATE